MRKIWLIAMLCLGICPAAAWGQALTSLRGTVTDPSGSAIRGAQVTVLNSETSFTRSTKSGPDGTYSFVDLLPGTYNLTIESQGFQKYVQSGLVLRVDLPATANAHMKVGAVSEVVSVTGEAAQVNTTDASVGHTMGANEIEELPIQAENMPLLLSLQPGVVYNGDKILTDSYDTRAGSVNGERSDQNNITLDGVSVNDEFNGYAFYGVLPTTQFSVDEFRVTTSNYGASEGRSAGAQIAMATKGGTNQFHGSLYEFNRNTIGEANDYFLKNSQLANGQSNTPTHLVRNVFGGTFGGPIIKDRLFFFFNYEGHRIAQQADEVRTIPSATLRDGIIQYACNDPTQCPGMTVKGLSGASYPIQSGYYALSPVQLGIMDPLHLGPSSVALKYMQTYPLPNDFTVGNVVNYAGYRFAANTPESDNWMIGRLDYKLTANGNHTLFLRLAGRNDHSVPEPGAPFLPGSPPEYSLSDVSKGFVIGHTGVFGPHWINNIRYGLTHQSQALPGDSSDPWVYMRDMDQGIVYSSGFSAPVHNLVDTVTWLKGSHNFQFGGNFLFVRRGSYDLSNSFPDALLNSDWLASGGFANKNDSLDPTFGCATGQSWPGCGQGPAISGDFNHAYDFPLAAMMGIASEVDAVYNYRVANLTSATPLSQGAPIVRHWATDTYSLFFQDTWHAMRRLTVTYGLNYQLMTPITETSGQEVTPNVNMGDWFNLRSTDMLKGIPSNKDPVISFQPSGAHWGRNGLYSNQHLNFAPRVGLAWDPTGDGKTSVRAGFGMYYDNFGPALALHYDQGGTFGLSSNLSNPAATLTLNQAPRISSMNTIPTTYLPGPPPSNFPVVYPLGSEAIARGIDQSIKTPYSYAANLSVQRQLPGGMTLDVGYVGHFAHHLLVLDDVAAPLDFVDPKSHIDYFTAAQRMSQLQRANTPESSITPALVGPTAAYWQNILPVQSSYALCSTGGTTSNLLMATYDAFGQDCGSLYNETTVPYIMDLSGIPATPIYGPNTFFNSQYSSLWDWRSIGYSNYNALEVGLHKQMTHGVLFGFNYTYSKSNDLESQAERGVHYLTDSIINAWAPQQMYAPSDFDLRHQINGYFVAELPFGHGKQIAGNAGGLANAFIGGWQLGGTTRWTSGYDVSVFQGYVWPTNWDEMGWSNLTGSPIDAGTTVINGIPNVFKNPAVASKAFDYAFPGQSGVRNPVRGDGFLEVDMNLAKNWNIPKTEHQTLQFRWSVFNVTNSARFDVYSMQDEWDSASTFGNYTRTLNNPRVMEFALIYQF
ncbi:MAG TPA: TonB-dependent receptor [Terriglobales bacterium]|nr:TonB-dependent receptor [Terriglobales bacterium]